ncbi:hypothetical protein ACWA1F_13135 [Flavobacterium sp. 3-218]
MSTSKFYRILTPVLLIIIKSSTVYSQNLPIVGFGDAANYRIDTYQIPGSSGLDLHWYGGIRFGDYTGNPVMQISNGNVGIGKDNPSSKFEVSSSLNTNQNEVIASLTRLGTGTGGSSIVRFGYHNFCDFEVNSGYSNAGHRFGNYFDLNIVNNHIGGDLGGINFATNSSVKMAINVNGNVGIGTTRPQNKLDVKGTIHSQEVKVDMENWSDFVFKKEYNLPTLDQVEKHIAEKGHLQNIPSEEEVLRNGINLGEMNAKLLQKIEEMTLYMIEMKKEIEQLKKNEK